MDTLHVVTQIPFSWETVLGLGPLAVLVDADKGLLAMAMHSVGLTLVAENAGSGRERNRGTSFLLAAVWPEVSIQVFAAHKLVSVKRARASHMNRNGFLLIVALELVRFVVTVVKGAVVSSIGSWSSLVPLIGTGFPWA